MRHGPLPDEPLGRTWYLARENRSIEGERSLLSLILGMEMRDAVIAAERADHIEMTGTLACYKQPETA